MSPSPFKSLATSKNTLCLPWRHLFALIVWGVITLGALSLVVQNSLATSARDFAEYGENFHAQIRDKLRANEAVLYGFSSFLGAINRDDRETASRYARSMLERYPQIYMLEVVRRVLHSELNAFTQNIRQKWYQDFQIKRFDYRGGRQWQAAAAKDAYYPIILAEPDLPQAQDIIGLDIDSLESMRAALVRSEKQGEPAASESFRLVEGDAAYVLFRPVPVIQERASNKDRLIGGVAYGLLVVRGKDLLPAAKALDPRVLHTAFMQIGQARDELFSVQPTGHQLLGQGLFAPLRIERNIEGVSQPIRLVLERQPTLADISGSALATVALASMLSLALLLAYAGASQRRQKSQVEGLRAMEHLALHDSLTGLPNRFMMLGRLEQTLTTAQRHGSRLAVLFLDIDGFKPVNDIYGHHIGDLLLKEIGVRLRNCIRENDTVARLGGDEFVVTLTDIREADDVSAVAEKILRAVAEPALVDGQEIQVSTSIGIAVYPDNGSDSESLLRAADAAMYEAKAEGRRIYRFAAPVATTPSVTAPPVP